MPTKFKNSLVKVLIALGLILGTGSVHAIDFTWEGKNYRDVKVVGVEGEEVSLRSKKDGDEITVPLSSLAGLLLSEAKRYAASGKGKEKRADARPTREEQDRFERCWIHGSASNGTKDGFQVYSTDRSLPPGKENSDGEYVAPRRTKGGAPIYNGIVFVKNMQVEDNSKFDQVLYRDGWVTRGLEKLPAFSSKKPDIRLPVLAEERVWTNAEGKQMEALLKKVVDGKGHFVSSRGTPFVYELAKLSAADQAFAKEAAEKHAKAVEQIKKDYPWLNLE